MKRVILDANTFLRLFLDDVPSQADEVVRVLEDGKEGKQSLAVPQIVIFEIAFALEKYYHFPKQTIIEKIKTILVMAYLRIQDREIFKDALELFGKENLSLSDCFLIYFAKESNAGIFTFDKKLIKLSGKIE